VKLVVLQVDVVNDLGDLAQTFVLAESKSLQHRLEGAVFAVMSELSPKHVEGNRAFDRFAFSNKIESRSLVDELFDQPGGGQPVDVQIAASHPALALILRDVEFSTSGF
jgi:hypothetical protein